MNLVLVLTNLLAPRLLTVLDNIGDAITEVASWIVGLVQSIIPIFYDATAATPTLTFIGWLTVIGFALGLVFAVVRIIRSYVRV